MNRLFSGFATLLLVSVLTATVSAAEWGDLKVRFVFDGDPPKPVPEVITKDQQFCGKHNLVKEDLVVDPKTKAISNVIVYLYLKRGEQQPPIHPDYEKSAKDEVALENSKCRFSPRVVLLRTTQTLAITNPDLVGHNTKIDPLNMANEASNDNLPAGARLLRNYTAAERLPTQVSCSIHPWMKGWVVIKDNPYMGVSDKDGNIVIKNVPAGKWTFQIWQERAGYVSKVSIDGKATSWKRGRVTVNMTKDGVDLGTVGVGPEVFEK